MRKLTVIIFLLVASLRLSAFSQQFVRRENLSSLDNATVYSIAQDSTKAIWISCSSGLMRYNGNSIRRIHDVLPMQEMSYDGGRNLWALTDDGLICVDILDLKIRKLRCGGEIDFGRSKLCADAGEPLLFSGSDVWSVASDSLLHVLSLPSGEEISSVGSDRSGKIYAAAGSTLWNISENGAFPAATLSLGITSLFFDCNGNLWVGFMHGGISLYNSSFEHVSSWQVNASNVRTFCQDTKGNIWAGSAASLHCLLPDGTCRNAADNSPMAQPVTTLLCDVSGNVWVGTFYSGVYMSAGIDVPFRNLSVPSAIRNVRSASHIYSGKIAVLTDGNGAWILDTDGSFREVSGSGNYKFTSSSTIEGTGSIYAGLYRGGLVRLTEHSITPVKLFSDVGPLDGLSVNALFPSGGKLYVGTDDGLFAFELTGGGDVLYGHYFEGADGQILSIGKDSQNHFWAAGRGLYVVDSAGSVHKISDGFYPALSCSDSGVWASEFGKGLSLFKNDGIDTFNDRNAGLADNSVSFVQPLPGGLLLLGTRSGFSIFDPSLGQSLNYSNRNGLGISSARNGCAVELENGNRLVFGTDGAAVLSVKDIPGMSALPPLNIDIIEAVGSESLLRPMGEALRLDHNNNDLLLEFATFDYSGVYSLSYEYSVGGRGEWIPFNPSAPLSMIGLRPGTYSIMTRPVGAEENVTSFSFSIMRPWYTSLWALALYSLIALALGMYLMYSLYTRLLLRQSLKDKEKENEERTRLFIKLSHELRTPLTSVIGQLSLFFKRYGTSLQGNALLRQSYQGALEMNRIVSNYLEVENSLEDEVDDLPTFDRSLMYPAGQGEYTMLVADDNAEMRSLLQDIFSEEYKLLIAQNGREACEIARKQQPDIIVSDVMMPEMDGLTLCATLRKDFETRHIPIVLITAHASERHNLEGLALGADDYIAKPFSVELLRARCRTLILNRKAQAEHMYMNNGAPVPSGEGRRDKFLNAAIGAVERNISSPQLNVALLCQEMHMSKTTLTLRLQESSGMSPRDFIEDVRLRHAARMIRDGQVRPAEIADHLNFSSPKYFSIRFRKKFGISPREYAQGTHKA